MSCARWRKHKAQLEASATQRAEAVVEMSPRRSGAGENPPVVARLGDFRRAQGGQLGSVKARVAGELQALSLREGDFVKAGQVVARVDVHRLAVACAPAQQQAESAKAQVDIAKRTFDNNRTLVDAGFHFQMGARFIDRHPRRGRSQLPRGAGRGGRGRQGA